MRFFDFHRTPRRLQQVSVDFIWFHRLRPGAHRFGGI